MSTAVFAFGRMNPPTIGHQKLVEKTRLVASQTAGDPFLYLSHSTGKPNNPLSYTEKAKLCTEAFGEIVKWSKAKHVIDIAQELQAEGYTNLVMVCGSDRIVEFRDLLNKYNDNQYFFENITVTSAGGRNPISEGVEGMSASKLRQYAIDENLEAFASGLPPLLRGKAEQVMELIKSKL